MLEKGYKPKADNRIELGLITPSERITPFLSKEKSYLETQSRADILRERAQGKEDAKALNSKSPVSSLKASESTKDRLDSIILVDIAGLNAERQIFTWNDRNLQTGRTMASWSAAAEDWNVVENHAFEWDGKDRLIRQELDYLLDGVIERYEYSYNDLDQISTQIVSFKIGNNPNWELYMKINYEYDSNEIINPN